MDGEENSDRFVESELPGVANVANREVNKVSLSRPAAEPSRAIGRIYADDDVTATQEDIGQGRVTHDDEVERVGREIVEDIPSPLTTGEIVEEDIAEKGVRGVVHPLDQDDYTRLRLKRRRDGISIVCLVFVVVSIGVVCIVTTNIQRRVTGEKARIEDENATSGTIDLSDALSMRGNGLLPPTPTPTGFTASDLDFVHITPQPTLERPFLERVALKPKPGATQPLLLACQGECSSDADCRGELICFRRRKGEQVPGCLGEDDSPSIFYCIEKLESSNVLFGEKREKFGMCEGECNSDGDCEGDLICQQRSGNEVVVGCQGLGKFAWDYCRPPDPSSSPTSSGPTRNATSDPSSSPTSTSPSDSQ